MPRNIVKRAILSILPLALFMYTFTFYVLYRSGVHLTPYVQCQYPSEVEIGETFDVKCYGNFQITNLGADTILIPLYTLPESISEAKITIIVPGMYFINRIIDDILPPDTITNVKIVIPDWSEYTYVWAKIYGKPDQTGDYPDYPYIKGGNYDLFGTIDTKFVQGLIIDRPGNYTLEIYSGRGGGGIEYLINITYGGYPAITLYLNDHQIFSQDRVSSNFPIEPSKYYFIQGINRLTVITRKVAGYNISIYLTYSCSTDILSKPKCMAYFDESKNATVYVCSVSIKSTCDLASMGTTLKIPISKLKLPKFEKATEILSVSIGGYAATYSNGIISTTQVPIGNLTLTIIYAVPGQYATAYKYGACLLQAKKLIFVGPSGQEKEITFYVANIGSETITVKPRPSDEIKDYVVVIPEERTIKPGEMVQFTVKAVIPSMETVGYLIVEGCEDAKIEVILSTSVPLLDLMQFIIPIMGSTSLFLLLRRKGTKASIAIIVSLAVFLMLLISYRFLIYGTFI